MQFRRTFTDCLPGEPTEDTVTPLNVSPNQFGVWTLSYSRKDTSGEYLCVRPICDAKTGHTVKWKDRKPIGQEVIDAVEGLIQRQLTLDESEELFATLKVIK